MGYVENRHGLGVNNLKSLANEIDKSKVVVQKALDEAQLLFDRRNQNELRIPKKTF